MRYIIATVLLALSSLSASAQTLTIAPETTTYGYQSWRINGQPGPQQQYFFIQPQPNGITLSPGWSKPGARPQLTLDCSRGCEFLSVENQAPKLDINEEANLRVRRYLDLQKAAK